MLGSTTGCRANGCSGFGMLVQAGRRWKAKNSSLHRARQAARWAPSGFPQQTSLLLFLLWNARIMRNNCAREEGMGAKRRGSPPHHVFWSLPQHVSAAWRVFSREKGRLSRPWPMAPLCEQQGAVCTTTALLFSVCALPSTAKPALSQGLLGILGRERMDHKALPLPQSHPQPLPEWNRAQT